MGMPLASVMINANSISPFMAGFGFVLTAILTCLNEVVSAGFAALPQATSITDKRTSILIKINLRIFSLLWIFSNTKGTKVTKEEKKQTFVYFVSFVFNSYSTTFITIIKPPGSTLSLVVWCRM